MDVKLIFREKVNKNSTSVFDLVVDGEKVGFLQLREKLSAGIGVPEHMESHIYYEIDERCRGKGYGTEILKLGLEEAKKLGFSEVIICVLEDNLPSKKIIEKNAGSFIEQADTPESTMLKYRVDLDNLGSDANR